jgi:hypothetical protein
MNVDMEYDIIDYTFGLVLILFQVLQHGVFLHPVSVTINYGDVSFVSN